MYPSRLVIHLARLKGNYHQIVEHFPGCKMAPVIKADAYGHGMVQCAKALEEEGVPYLSVFTVDEGAALRAAGVRTRLILLGGVMDASECGAAVRLDNAAFPVWNMGIARELSREAQAAGRRVDVHLTVDTGMSRLGFYPEECPEAISLISSLPGLRLKGAFTHLASADCPEKDYNARQCNAFRKVVGMLPEEADEIHQSATPGMLAGVGLEYPILRPGFVLYGYGSGPHGHGMQLQPVMEFETSLISIKEVPPGAEISYGGIYKVEGNPRRIAVLPVGYADGYPRRLSNQADVLVRGRRAPIRGRICMGMLMADVTEIPEARPGDRAVLLGADGTEAIDAVELAHKLDTIPYELLCRLGAHQNRVFIS